MNFRIVQYSLAALIVVMLGALAGWYFFLRTQNAATSALDAARGLVSQGSAPFGTAPSQLSGILPSITQAPVSAGAPPILWQVASDPAAGVGFATTSAQATASPTLVRFVDRATGYVFSADPVSGATIRLTDTLMPKIYDAEFAGGQYVVERSLDSAGNITTFAGVISNATSSGIVGTLEGTFLPPNVRALSADAASQRLFFVSESTSGTSGIVSSADGTGQKQLFTSPLSDWRPYLLSDGREFIAQSAADSVPGYAYQVESGTFVPLLSDIPGLVILPRAYSSALLYSSSQSGVLSLYVRAAASSTAVLLPLHTTAEKCAWAPGQLLIAYCAVPQTTVGDFLDQWYRGEVHSSDAIWKVDASAGQAQLFFTPDQKTPVDVEGPTIDDSGTYLAFVNASDLTPWVLHLVQ